MGPLSWGPPAVWADQCGPVRPSSAGGHQRPCPGRADKKADVEGPGMGRPVGPTSPARSMAKRTGRPLKRDVMDDLVVAALQEGRIDRAKGFQPRGRHAGAEGDAVLFGDPDIEGPGSGTGRPSGRPLVPPGIAAVTATIAGSARGGAGQSLAEHLGIWRAPLGRALAWAPVATSNLPTPCRDRRRFRRGRSPCP